MGAIGLGEFILVHPSAVSIRGTVLVSHPESPEAAIGAKIPRSQRYVGPHHGTAEYKPGFASPPRIAAGLPELRDGTDHVPGDNIELQAEPVRLLILAVVVEPQAPFIGP